MKLAWDIGRVDSHDGGYHRERSADPYHTARWTRLSKAFRADPANALCAECKRQGRITAAAVVDHIVPYPVCADFYDRSNLQALCEKCNHEKGQRDKKIIEQWRQANGGR